MKKKFGLYLAVTVASLLSAAPDAAAKPGTVDCDKNGSLAKALSSSVGSAETLVINLVGTCYESVTINRDRVSIVGDGGTEIVGRIRVFGSDNVQFFNLAITGTDSGLTIRNSRVRLIDVRVTGNEGVGIALDESASIQMNGGEVSNNAGTGVSLRGSYARFSDTPGLQSVADLTDVQIYGNVGQGAALWAGSGLFVSGTSNIPASGAGWSVQCDGKESSVRVHAPATVAAVDCSDPDF
jgi:hypothetical protein